jgi:hypothetical protein
MIARFAVLLAEHERTAARPAPRELHHVLRDGSALGSVGYDANGNVTVAADVSLNRSAPAWP